MFIFVPIFFLSSGPCGLKPFYVFFIGSNIRRRLGHLRAKGRFLAKKVKILFGISDTLMLKRLQRREGFFAHEILKNHERKLGRAVAERRSAGDFSFLLP
jgi:hypothetical protein